ncbi:MAG: gamma-glutamyltranspeptidase [Zetaproteobacteria bacterium CG06_land_8_20_14_3_00_59_53]|nr:MAG: gamma-glutamyltranspeptidase [Zetaproteobacteria bacterium CG2_30_59_37]PIO89237.1 MAG: gamma-glutamyltranspeptidase [Zetaproteobacteria bacterium CG23_combo_of_CG06-09_8_20_14_all_59_86]PIQ64054.1 MAG: gamma-glutamyltranspeptidase [Zetaproteobacteria bacterium CG11_big_fil_rev_8_21_14_0_20_59_439]PIU69616.1 MAG: gamma-glutamyltranspeptidase [Zetaproteobacteria bacterium CG06_land_8_20_14_3_00_59_53]PIU96271.1 MAG: gamma-glutamyltranspeptidase [Zetaproteobacteria bacterium CG03_land_8_2
MAASRNRGCVAAGHPITAEAGAGILRAGGNAVDAAVAAACMSFLAEPVLTGAGGGGFMLLCRPDGASLLLDGFARMPAGLGESTPPEDFKAIPVDFGDTVQTFHIGRGSVATPGLMSMLFSAQQRYGRIPMREVLAPAMHAARHGVTLNALQASFIHLLDPILSSTGPCKAMHSSKDGLLKAGESFSNPDLANLLELLCMEGVDEMYLGDVARSIVSACQPGGLLGMGDLAACRVIERRPLNIKALNGVLLSNPPPSSGGPLIGFSLLLLEEMRRQGHGMDASLLTECLRESSLARNADFDAMVHRHGFADDFLHKDRIDRHAVGLAERISRGGARSSKESANRHGSTTHISVLDKDGMAVSMTTSNGEGSGIMVPGTGIHLNNMLGEEDINPLGFHQLKAGETLSSMMAPSILLRDGRPALILGSGGSNRLRGAILQVLLRHAERSEPIEKAVHAPRLHPEGYLLDAEPGALNAAGYNALRQLGWKIRQWSDTSVYFGGVHAISMSQHGIVEAAGDPRRGGAVAWA